MLENLLRGDARSSHRIVPLSMGRVQCEKALKDGMKHLEFCCALGGRWREAWEIARWQCSALAGLIALWELSFAMAQFLRSPGGSFHL